MVDEEQRFFGEDDPEWAVSQLAAQVAATAKVRRRVSWHIVFGSILTTVLVVGAFVLGLNEDESSDPQGDPQADPQPTGVSQPTPIDLPRARRVTLAPKPEPVPTPAPTVTVVVTQQPEPAPEPAPAEPSEPSSQVGPNRPITTPIDPDDR